jgi:hypothetical protein
MILKFLDLSILFFDLFLFVFLCDVISREDDYFRSEASIAMAILA